jgi:phospholipid-binding lipoprotein MlaA
MAQENPDNELDTEFDEDFFDDEEEVIVFDPIEPVNRGIFWFNDKLYFYLLKPVAKVYRVVPERARVSVSKFFSNIYTPIRLVNALLQLKFKDTGTEFARFVMNTTIGIGGLFDPAKKYAGMEKKEEDFGQTLGRYGAGPGFYIVLPLFGPSNIRDGIGRIADAFLDPIYYLDIKTGERIAIKAYYVVNTLSLDKDTYEGIKKDALDPYLFIRDAYAQKREGEIRK